MNAFEWANPKSLDEVTSQLGVELGGAPGRQEYPRPIAGGQDLHTTLKAYIVRPPRVVNLKTVPGLGRIDADAQGLTIGATATLTEVAEHGATAKLVPGLAEAIHAVATPQIRNLGTVGGNLCQKPRCWYYRLEDVQCLKRGGDTCYAKDGENKYLALFGTDAPCVMAHPSDLAPLLVAVGGVVTVTGIGGTRDVPAAAFFRMPTAEDVWAETVVDERQWEIVTKVRVPASPLAARSTYLKFKERSSLDFAMAGVAAAVELDGKTVKSARVVLSGVAPVPWALPKVDAYLAGKTLDDATLAGAAGLAVEGAKPLSQTGYKVPLVRTLVRRALSKLA